MISLQRQLIQGGYVLGGLILAFPLFYLFSKALNAGLPWDWGTSFKPILLLFINSLAITVLVTVLSVSLGLILAFLVVKTDLPGKKFWQVAMALPLSIPTYIGAVVYTTLLAPHGMVYQWLGKDLWNIYGADGVIFVLTLFTFPYSFLICCSQFKKMGTLWEEAAFDLGKGKRTVICRILIPLCRPALLSSGLLIGLYVLADFGAITLLRFNTFTTVIFYQLDSFDREKASFLGLILLFLALMMIHCRDQLLKKTDYASLGETLPRPSLYCLGKYKGPALLLLGTCLLFSVVIPLLILFYNILSEEIEWENLFPPLFHSLLMALGVAFMTTWPGAFVSYALKVWKGWGQQFFKKIVFSLYGVPGILIALGTLFIARTMLGSFYGTVIPLALGLFIRFFPQALEAMAWGKKAMGQNLMEASFDLGQGHWATLRRVFFPLIRGAMGASFLVVFISVLKELPLQLVLRPPGIDTLSTRLWIDANEGLYGQASLYGIMIILLTAMMTPLILKKYS